MSNGNRLMKMIKLTAYAIVSIGGAAVAPCGLFQSKLGIFVPAFSARPQIMRRLSLASLLLSSAAMTLSPAAYSKETETSAAPTEASEPAEDIVVTARFRNERLQDVPIAIGAVTGAQLAASHNDTLRQIQQQVPSLQILGFNPRNVSITIRGLGTNAGITNDGLEQGVGIYIDGVYHAKPSVAVTDLVDIERIDVLRGPQGTLFGKNTTAGAISITSKQPTFTPETSGEITIGNYGFKQGKLALSGGLTDSIAARLTLYGTHRDGTLYNTHYDKDWDTYNNWGVRGQLLFQPSTDFKLRLVADYNKQAAVGGIYVAKEVLPTTLANGATTRGFYTRAEQLGYTPLPVDPFARNIDIDTSQHYALQIGGISAQADWTLPSGHSLTSITAFRRYKWSPSVDGDFIGIPILTLGNIPTNQRQFTQELRLSGPTGGAIDYSLGLYYFWQKSASDYYLGYGSAASAWVIAPTAPSAILNNFVSYANYAPVTNSYSGFGQATWHIASRLDLTGGLRYTYERKHGTFNGYAAGDFTPIAELPTAWQATATTLRNAIAPTLSYTARANGGNWSGTANLSYKATDDILAYASYSRGFKSKGINFASVLNAAQRVVDPEKVNSFELGLKSQWLDRRLTVNAALFWSEVSDYQGTNVDASRGLSYLSNVGKVRSRGVELDVRANPVEGLTLNASGTYTDAKYVSFPSSTCPYLYSYQASCDLSGQRLAGVSKWAGSAGFEYARDIGQAGKLDLEGYAGADVSYRSSYFSALNDDPFSLVPGYALVGAHAGIRSADGRWDLSVWARNLLDKNYYNVINVYSSTLVANASLGEPRFLGLTLKAKY